MLEKVNYKSVIKSFLIGIVIGAAILIYSRTFGSFKVLISQLIVSGVIGLLIGAITEVITAILPIDIARIRTYFFLNNIIAIVTASIVLVIIYLLGEGKTGQQIDKDKVIIMSCIIIAIANTIDYLMYKNTNKKLSEFQSRNSKKAD